MEFFRDKEHVRLRRREDGRYLHANENGWNVSMSLDRASLNTAWTVHILENISGTATYILLHGAAYGRYLCLRREGNDPNPDFFQGILDYPRDDVLWEADADGDEGVRLQLCQGHHEFTELFRWTVEAIPARQAPPDLPGGMENGVDHPPVILWRTIRYIRADNFGIFDPPLWRNFLFDGRSLRELIAALVNQLHEVNFNGVTLCVRAGFYGRLTPLVTDLPRSEEPMDIVVLTTGSPAALELQHPDVGAP